VQRRDTRTLTDTLASTGCQPSDDGSGHIDVSRDPFGDCVDGFRAEKVARCQH